MLSIALFVVRGAMQWARPGWRPPRWLRILPHANDTLLLCAAITLAVLSSQYPLQQPWLTAKVLALLAYIGLGRVALRPKGGQLRRKLAFVADLLTVTYIVGVAISKSAVWGLIGP